MDRQVVQRICGTRISAESEISFLVKFYNDPTVRWIPCNEVARDFNQRHVKDYLDCSQLVFRTLLACLGDKNNNGPVVNVAPMDSQGTLDSPINEIDHSAIDSSSKSNHDGQRAGGSSVVVRPSELPISSTAEKLQAVISNGNINVILVPKCEELISIAPAIVKSEKEEQAYRPESTEAMLQSKEAVQSQVDNANRFSAEQSPSQDEKPKNDVAKNADDDNGQRAGGSSVVVCPSELPRSPIAEKLQAVTSNGNVNVIHVPAIVKSEKEEQAYRPESTEEMLQSKEAVQSQVDNANRSLAEPSPLQDEKPKNVVATNAEAHRSTFNFWESEDVALAQAIIDIYKSIIKRIAEPTSSVNKKGLNRRKRIRMLVNASTASETVNGDQDKQRQESSGMEHTNARSEEEPDAVEAGTILGANMAAKATETQVPNEVTMNEQPMDENVNHYIPEFIQN